jgi:F-type H+-transporting ATPase subunit c
MELEALKYVAIGSMAIAMLGSALGVSNIFSSLLNSISRNPSATGDMQRLALIGAGLSEAMGLFAFVIAMLLIF